MFFVSKGNPFLLLFYSTLAGVVQRWGRKKSPRTPSSCRLYFISFGIIEHILVILKIEYRLNRRCRGMGRGVCSSADYSVAYEETKLNRVSDFRGFVYSLFPKAILFYFYYDYGTTWTFLLPFFYDTDTPVGEVW